MSRTVFHVCTCIRCNTMFQLSLEVSPAFLRTPWEDAERVLRERRLEATDAHLAQHAKTCRRRVAEDPEP